MNTSVSGVGMPDVRAPEGGSTVVRRPWNPDRTAVGENVLVVRDRVQWGPIAGGAMVGAIVLLALTLLGLAIGASALDPKTDLGDWNTRAALWGGFSVLVASLAAGWVASATAAVDGPFAGMMNGLLAGATMIAVLVVLTATGLTNLVGFLGGNLANVADYARQVANGESVTADRQAAFDAVRDGAWGALVTVVVALAAAAMTGALAHHDRRELIEGTGK
jgi:hypothetical protein